MKGSRFVSAGVLALGFVTTTLAQPNWVGVIGGLNFANLDVDSGKTSSRNAYGFGAVLEFGLGEKLALRIEPMFLQKGAKIDVEENAAGLSGEFKMSCVEVPVLFKMPLGGGDTAPYLLAGPTIGFMTSSKVSIGILGITVDADFKSATKTLDVGIAFGGGIQLPVGQNRIFLEAKYSLGLADVAQAGEVKVLGMTEPVPDTDVKTRGIQIMAGVTMPVGGK